VSHVDATAMHVLKEMMEDFTEQRKVKFMIANPNQQVMRSLQHDEKVWEMLNPCERCDEEGCEGEMDRSGGAYYGNHDSNLFVRVHDAVRESVWYLKEKIKAEDLGPALGDFEEDSRVFFNDLAQDEKQ